MSVWEILLAMKTENVWTSTGDFTVDATAATLEMEWRTAQVYIIVLLSRKYITTTAA